MSRSPKDWPWPIRGPALRADINTFDRKPGEEYITVDDLEEKPWLHPENLALVYNLKQATPEQFNPVWELLHGKGSDLPQPRCVVCDDNLYCYDTSRKNKGDRVKGPRLPCVHTRFWIDQDGNFVFGDCEYHSASKNCHHRNQRVKPIWDRNHIEDRGLSRTLPNYVKAPNDAEIMAYKYPDGRDGTPGKDRREYCLVEDWALSEKGILPESGIGKRSRSSLAHVDDNQRQDDAPRQRRKYSNSPKEGNSAGRKSSTSSRTLVDGSSPSTITSSPTRDMAISSSKSPAGSAPRRKRGRPRKNPLADAIMNTCERLPSVSQTSTGSTASYLRTLRLDSAGPGASDAEHNGEPSTGLVMSQPNVNRYEKHNQTLMAEIKLLKQYREMYYDMEEDFEALEKGYTEAESLIETLQEEKCSLEATLLNAKVSKEKLKGKLATARENLSAKDEEISRYQAESSTATGRISELSSENEALKEDKMRLLADKANLGVEVGSLKTEKLEKALALELLETSNRSLKTELATAQLASTGSLEDKKKLEELQLSLEEKDKQTQGLKTRASELELKYSLARDTHNEMVKSLQKALDGATTWDE